MCTVAQYPSHRSHGQILILDLEICALAGNINPLEERAARFEQTLVCGAKYFILL